jgi:hypothetical protein
VLIPAPALAEVLATPDCDIDEVVSALRGSAYIRDERAVDSRGRRDHEARMKFDRQIALTNGTRIPYSDDDGVKKFGERSGLKVVRTCDLPLPIVQQDFLDGKPPERAE